MNFVGADKKRFQLEVTETASQRADHRYEVQGQRKGIAPSGSSSFRSFLRVFFLFFYRVFFFSWWVFPCWVSPGFRRYYTAEGRQLVKRLLAAEEQRDAALNDISRRIFGQFARRSGKRSTLPP